MSFKKTFFYLWPILIGFQFSIFKAETLQKRIEPLSLKSSVIIPCHLKHLFMIDQLLNEYAYKQKVIPNEVIVILSPCKSLTPKTQDYIKKIKKYKWPYSLQFIQINNLCSPGNARNIGCSHATYDIFLCQDADDIPHPQRVQIIKYFFENFEVDHLMHAFVISTDTSIFKPLSLNELNYKILPQYELIHNIANGPVSISRKLFTSVKWTNKFIWGEDVLFNKKAYELKFNCIIIQENLYLYRRGFK